jgi:hypothetical protein
LNLLYIGFSAPVRSHTTAQIAGHVVQGARRSGSPGKNVAARQEAPGEKGAETNAEINKSLCFSIA